MDDNLKNIIFGGLEQMVTDPEWEVITPECRYLRNIRTGEIEELQPCPHWEGVISQEYEGSFTKLMAVEQAIKEDEEEFPLFV